MKIKPTRKRGMLVELGPKETQFLQDDEFQLKRVLVPVDFSACSLKALAYAIPFAKQFAAEMVLLYVVQPYIPVPEMTSVDTEEILAQMRRDGTGELEKLRLSITEDLNVRTVLRVGHPSREIVAAAEELNVDLILLSTHGRTGLGRMFLGSVAEHVTRYAKCPVLTVREREHEFVRIPSTSAGIQSTGGNATSLKKVSPL